LPHGVSLTFAHVRCEKRAHDERDRDQRPVDSDAGALKSSGIENVNSALVTLSIV
jgi:hypothetical protein